MKFLDSMSPRDRRALTLGLVVLVPALLFIYGARPFLSNLSETRDRLAIERETLARERAAVTAARLNPGMQNLADSAMRAMTPRLFEGRDDVMATAELVSHLGALARQSHVWLQSATTRPAKVGEAGVRTLQVELRAESDLQGLLWFLEALEHGEKLLRVERLDVSRSQSTTAPDGVEPVSITASVVGFAIPDEGAGVPAVPATPARAQGGAR